MFRNRVFGEGLTTGVFVGVVVFIISTLPWAGLCACYSSIASLKQNPFGTHIGWIVVKVSRLRRLIWIQNLFGNLMKLFPHVSVSVSVLHKRKKTLFITIVLIPQG